MSAVRRELQFYLQKHLERDDHTLSVVNLAEPPSKALGDPPIALSGVRKAYWEALQANQAAQAKYDALKADLDQFKRQSLSEDCASTGGSVCETIYEDYIPLLRQKEHLRRLQVLDQTLTSAGADSVPSTATGLDDLVKKSLGEPPTPPTCPLPKNSCPHSVEARVLELKKSLLSTKRRANTVASQQQTSHSPSDSHKPSEEAHIAGLQSALQVLTRWMDDQLNMIANAEAEEPEPATPDPSAPDTTPAAGLSPSDLEALYARYLDARYRLVEAVTSPPDLTSTAADASPLFPAPSHQPSDPPASPSLTLLPHIPSLLSAKNAEASAMQRTALLRRVVDDQEAETERLVRRLAGESHLVPPNASCSEDWAQAGAEAARATKSAVLERLKAGDEALNETEATLDAIEAMPLELE